MAKADRLIGLGMPSALASEVTAAPVEGQRGMIERQPSIPNAAGANPTKEEFDALLAALRAAGVVSPLP